MLVIADEVVEPLMTGLMCDRSLHINARGCTAIILTDIVDAGCDRDHARIFDAKGKRGRRDDVEVDEAHPEPRAPAGPPLLDAEVLRLHVAVDEGVPREVEEAAGGVPREVEERAVGEAPLLALGRQLAGQPAGAYAGVIVCVVDSNQDPGHRLPSLEPAARTLRDHAHRAIKDNVVDTLGVPAVRGGQVAEPAIAEDPGVGGHRRLEHSRPRDALEQEIAQQAVGWPLAETVIEVADIALLDVLCGQSQLGPVLARAVEILHGRRLGQRSLEPAGAGSLGASRFPSPGGRRTGTCQTGGSVMTVADVSAVMLRDIDALRAAGARQAGLTGLKDL